MLYFLSVENILSEHSCGALAVWMKLYQFNWIAQIEVIGFVGKQAVEIGEICFSKEEIDAGAKRVIHKITMWHGGLSDFLVTAVRSPEIATFDREWL